MNPMTQIVISLLATAISFIDTAIAQEQPKGIDVSEYIDARHVISSAISMLRGDADTDDKIESMNERRKDKKKKKNKEEK